MTISALAPTTTLDALLHHTVERACARIAPAWPLDRLIAVNPYWGWHDHPVAQAAARLGSIAGTPLTMPRAWYHAQWRAGRIRQEDLRAAIAERGGDVSMPEAIDALRLDAAALPRHPLITDARPALRGGRLQHSWESIVLEQVGRACESYFDAGQAQWRPAAELGLYAHWRALAGRDAAAMLLLGQRQLLAAVHELPEHPDALIAEALDTLSLPVEAREAYLTAVLMSVGGWAAACAHRRWEARLAGRDDDTLMQLLAVRLAWELLLYRTAVGTDLIAHWTQERRAWPARANVLEAQQRVDWVLQRAFELGYQRRLTAALAAVPAPAVVRSGPAAPAVIPAQAVFCIDVRSEVFRRALEKSAPGVQTLGFAGFFGIPLAYATPGGDLRPQLPGLLAPAVVATDDPSALDDSAEERTRAADRDSLWSRTVHGAPGMFSAVETTGLGALATLVRASFAPSEARLDPARGGLDAPERRETPRITRSATGGRLDVRARADLAAGALRGMGLTDGFARLVAFVGHGVSLRNNPQSAGLACGACGGQSGEVNARVLAELLNDPALREELALDGIVIPPETKFVGGLHDTCTDEVTLYPDPRLESTHDDDLRALRTSFAYAGRIARRERAPSLGLGDLPDEHLADAMLARTLDWSEVRPEWGLAGNAAFIAAPRGRTRELNLQGRAFLHEYDWRRDPEFAVLTTIMTAPMVVAHWINAQYYASTVDPLRFGSGDKTLHNVAANGLGVYEGTGGDLRIGLAMQSVHDGSRFVHEPMRLAVYLEAPSAAIDGIIARHETVRRLVDGEWLFLHCIEPDSGIIKRRRQDGWVPAV